ncbi:hypothetical protein FHY55_12770 [Oceanicola sp. D3]|uniref:recombinase family protein n=1 Tax=Oceanicola sp. D3 TaxID=2587163 RepID=UPI00111CE19A|nr:recombinase family protein [Oceanicola sp. D3]QDC11613.1 hypothetical protein FHY55_12770 [Oceanicola sp. D3]
MRNGCLGFLNAVSTSIRSPFPAGEGGVALRATVTWNADQSAAGLAEVIAQIRAEGRVSLRVIAAELNARGILTRRRGRWQVSNVRGLVLRLAVSGLLQARRSH